MLNEDYEEFKENETAILKRYVTNIKSHVFALKNLPEVIKGALFSRYSRSALGLRSLLLKEFISNEEEAAFHSITAHPDEDSTEEQTEAIQKAQAFYDRILDGYGDDSIGELGGAHLAIENISMLAAKVIEDSRIGGSPLEKSTRYIYFDQKVNGSYLFYKEPILMTSAYRDLFLETCNHLFDTYSQLIDPMTQIIEAQFPKDPQISKSAYTASLRAKVLDCLRGLLPTAALTNMGLYGNGRFFEQLIHRLHAQNLVELQEIGKKSQEELSKVIPSFVRRADPQHKTHKSYAAFREAMQNELKSVIKEFAPHCPRHLQAGVKMITSDPASPKKVAAALLFSGSDRGFGDLLKYCEDLSDEQIAKILETACSARENRRHKSPRALEHAEFTFEIIADFGSYRDLHRHRILTQDRQLLSCDYGFYTPPEIQGTALEEPYCHALQKARLVYEKIAAELPEEAQYVVPMAYNIRWIFHLNLRTLQWLCELRSSPAGHPTYRKVAQEMARQVCEKFPDFERFFKFVDYEDYSLGRLDQEQRKFEKQQKEESLKNLP